MKYLFWNTHRNTEINLLLCDLIAENNISLVVLAEYSANVDELIWDLNVKGFSMQQYPTIGCDRISIVGACGLNIEQLTQTDHASIQLINNNIILCCIHLNSKIYSSHEEKREIYITHIIHDILETEKKHKTNKTIVVGDFNINPYDNGCVGARYFHSLPIYEESKRRFRTVSGEKFYMFYNPMWNLLGDFNKPYGTYYNSSADPLNTYWNIYDQVIFRPSLRESFVSDSLKILCKTKNESLLDEKGHPKCSISDHLPIVFEIKEEQL